jgi:hypothetical protein
VEIDPLKIYAVLTGDIIGSSKLDKELRERLPLTMKQGAEMLHNEWPEAVPFPVDIYAGDSWQMLVVEPGMALRAAVFYRAFLIDATAKEADTRTVISLGTIDFLSQERISESDGEAFRNAGKFLQETKSRQNMHFLAPHDPQESFWNCTVGLLDAIIRHWSAKQARAVAGAIRGLSQTEIAASWKSSASKPPLANSTVSWHLDEAGWDVVEQLVQQFEQHFI